MLRIGVDALALVPGRTGGGETYLVKLMDAIGALDHTNEYVVFALPEAEARLRSDHPNIGVHVCRIPRLPRLTIASRLIYEQVALPRLISRLRMDVMIFPLNTMALRCPCKSLLVVHDLVSLFYAENLPGRLGRVREWAQPRLVAASARRANRVLTDSEFARQELICKCGVPAEKTEVVHLGVDEDLARDCGEGLEPPSEVREAMRDPYILFVGYQHIHKNLDRLALAFARMKDGLRLPHRLLIVGKEETGSQSLQTTLRGLARDDILVLGRVPGSALPLLYRHASLFVFPSLYEGFGLPPLEAMAYGVPVVAANAGPVPEVVGDAAVLFDPLDVDSIANAMGSVLTDPSLADRLRHKGLSRVGRDGVFSWQRTARATLDSAMRL